MLPSSLAEVLLGESNSDPVGEKTPFTLSSPTNIAMICNGFMSRKSPLNEHFLLDGYRVSVCVKQTFVVMLHDFNADAATNSPAFKKGDH